VLQSALRFEGATGLKTTPIYYCAGYKEAGQQQQPPYNLSKLLYYIVSRIPAEKRIAFVDAINEDRSAWQDSDGNYSGRLFASIGEAISDGSDYYAEKLKEKFSWPGWAVGKVFGGAYGFVIGVADALVNR
jgi:hypothetical protein